MLAVRQKANFMFFGPDKTVYLICCPPINFPRSIVRTAGGTVRNSGAAIYTYDDVSRTLVVIFQSEHFVLEKKLEYGPDYTEVNYLYIIF